MDWKFSMVFQLYFQQMLKNLLFLYGIY